MDKYLRVARNITQEYIEKFGATFLKIDEMDKMIADAIRSAIEESNAEKTASVEVIG